MSDNGVRMDDSKLYLVWLFREIGTLGNVLYAIAHYKKVMGGLWPSGVVIHTNNRMTFGLGDDTVVSRRDRGVLICALYLSTFAPKMDRSDGVRTPTVDVGRQSIGRRFRNRRGNDQARELDGDYRGPVGRGGGRSNALE